MRMDALTRHSASTPMGKRSNYFILLFTKGFNAHMQKDATYMIRWPAHIFMIFRTR